MSARMLRSIPTTGILSLLMLPSIASAQYGYDPCNACAAPPVCQPCMQAVVQPCYRTVPVTEYRAEVQTVQRPEVYTEYEDHPCTVMEPVVEQRTAEIPTVTYRNVTECQAVTRDCGRWVTHRIPNQRCAPCAVDARPGFAGWLNRTGFEIRQAFAPRYTTHREYVPNVVTTMVPTTRVVAEHGTRQVAYNVTTMVQRPSTRRVAVMKTRMVAQEITVQRPVTVMKTIPIGTSIAYVPFGSAGTATAMGPQPDPISRSADSRDDRDGRFRRKDAPFKEDNKVEARKSSFQSVPQRTTIDEAKATTSEKLEEPRRISEIPSAVRVSQARVPGAIRLANAQQ